MGGQIVLWLFSLFALYLVILFGVKNGIKEAIKELEIRLEAHNGYSVLSVKDKEILDEMGNPIK